VSRIVFPAFLLVSVFCLGAVNAQPASKTTSIPRRGDTTLTAKSAGLNVRVVITTAETQRAAPTWDPRFYAPKSWVENLVITANGKEIFVPLSAFLDLFDLNAAEVRLEGKKGVLTVHGADASLSYWAGIEFDAERVTRRRRGPADPAGAVTQETTYRTIVVE
jgi:hypothetical protein